MKYFHGSIRFFDGWKLDEMYNTYMNMNSVKMKHMHHFGLTLYIWEKLPLEIAIQNHKLNSIETYLLNTAENMSINIFLVTVPSILFEFWSILRMNRRKKNPTYILLMCFFFSFSLEKCHMLENCLLSE